MRALAAAGWEVGVAAPAGRGLASSSRACRHRHVVAPVQHEPAAFVDTVVTALASRPYDVVFGAGEAEVLALSAARDRLPAVLPHAPHAVVVRALDKGEVEPLATAAGLAVPDPLDLDDLDDEERPVVVKARVHARPDRPGAPPRIDTNVVTGASAARRRVAEVRRLGGDPQVQVFHEGRLLAYAAVLDPGGGVVADSMQVASRIWPPRAGASCRATTVEVDRTLAERSLSLLRALGWAGLAELQFVVPPDGVPRLIDLNGRFYGSLALAVAAGANLPDAWGRSALGMPVTRVRARAGVRYHWGQADLRRARLERRGGLLRDVAGTAAWAAGASHSIARAGDPGPALAALRGEERQAQSSPDSRRRRSRASSAIDSPSRAPAPTASGGSSGVSRAPRKRSARLPGTEST